MKWNAELYDTKHAFVSQYGESVVELLDVKPGERILDLGCGTGQLADHIRQQGAEVIGADASPEMIAKAQATYPQVEFVVADGTNYHFDEPFDAVFSNATLHWIKDAEALTKNVYKSLKPGGRFVVEMGGKGNMDQIVAATTTVLTKYGYGANKANDPWYFPSPAEYAAHLEAAGFRVTFMVHFDRPTLLQDGRQGVGKWLQMFGYTFFKDIPETELKQILEEITDILEPDYNKNGEWYADYKRLRFIAVREK
ncbi:class I SAM-dependent methyltransferase [Mucilaginibacter myungsuensis]|uniref:Methyltransferase domain-containing protein n=1 Tax=Mucilaginibacter myungsuensis TaxID=649104 RepID=A0A929KSV1_9SPHI|nr:class I SAM-dependent methyltransferase [Mucilaginibacter myungsuensis]MBE9660909.1 methyltransferase domain-containing protein [Mucilaginibacter myungsuensis]MDN3600955.1 methyltransferase domain-containing protein [Mucilaginibacter myungsuensis]